MATYQQWSQSYFTDLTLDQHNVNNQWFQSMRDKLTDSGVLYVPILDKEFNKLGEEVDTETNNCMQTFIPGFHDQRSIIMKWAVKLYVAGKIFEEKVHAVNYQDAKETALARNPKAKVVSVNPTYQD